MSGMGLSHPLQDTSLSRSPHTDNSFYKFTITTLRSKPKIPLKVQELEGVITESKAKQKGGLNTGKIIFFFSLKLYLIFLKQMHCL